MERLGLCFIGFPVLLASFKLTPGVEKNPSVLLPISNKTMIMMNATASLSSWKLPSPHPAGLIFPLR